MTHNLFLHVTFFLRVAVFVGFKRFKNRRVPNKVNVTNSFCIAVFKELSQQGWHYVKYTYLSVVLPNIMLAVICGLSLFFSILSLELFKRSHQGTMVFLSLWFLKKKYLTLTFCNLIFFVASLLVKRLLFAKSLDWNESIMIIDSRWFLASTLISCNYRHNQLLPFFHASPFSLCASITQKTC